ncbi:phosphatase PAP2 family protein [Gimesia algae]|uniref:PAP2 superfamily protein n=1 Tax=Gimesia algae TaxID=2527971 RepID=A0A517VIF0_9PLAN|nr:phosphatase PAP2 family protein [Gimesia algae]QDT92789.1 PAP2 superfamily protein [Gimesia algae]
MKQTQTLILQTNCARSRGFGRIFLLSVCLLALVQLTGCISTNTSSRGKWLRSTPQLSPATSRDAKPGIQHKSDQASAAVEEELGLAVLRGDDPMGSDWLNPPREVLTEYVQADEALPDGLPASVVVTGFLSEEPLGEFGCVNPSFETEMESERLTLWSQVKSDHANYYSKESLTWLAGGFGIGAIMANTSLDGGIQNHSQSSVLSASSDEWLHGLHAQKELGNGRYTIPLFAAAWVAGAMFETIPLVNRTGEWGERSIRAIIVGTPPMLAMQLATGASRPGETTANAKWKPFQDNNGVSGHSFMGAIPFLDAAKVTDKPLLKLAFYAGSTLVPLSRINDNRHYPSQVFLGWWMAWIATNAVDATQNPDRHWSVYPISWSGVTGVGFEYNW